MQKKRLVIKLSGRVFDPKDPKIANYAAFVTKITKYCQPILVAGGGSIARHYISHARSSGADESTLDDLGIIVSRLNARLLISALGKKAYPGCPETLPDTLDAADGGLAVVTGGLYPGQSTNGTAALIAEKVGATRFINATDVDGVYDMDPNKHKNARLFKSIPVKQLRGMLVNQESVAGGHDLMDLVSLKIIERSKINTRIVKADPQLLTRAIRASPTAHSPGTLITF